MNKSALNKSKQFTIAELCEALANGTISAEIKNGQYLIRRRDLARIAHADTLKPAARTKRPVFTVVGVA